MTRSGTKSDVNEATWTAAESRRWPWSRLWSRWRGRERSRCGTCARDPVRAILLLGIFRDVAAVRRVQESFVAAAFAAHEVVCVPAKQDNPGDTLLAKLYRSLTRLFGYQSQEQPVIAIDAPEIRARIQRVLESGGGLVLVRSANRFPQACEIIHQAGGRVGVQ